MRSQGVGHDLVTEWKHINVQLNNVFAHLQNLKKFLHVPALLILPTIQLACWNLTPGFSFSWASNKWDHKMYLCQSFSFNVRTVRFIHVVTQSLLNLFPHFFILHCMTIPQFIHSFCWWTFSWFPVCRHPAVVNNCTCVFCTQTKPLLPIFSSHFQFYEEEVGSASLQDSLSECSPKPRGFRDWVAGTNGKHSLPVPWWLITAEFIRSSN